MTPSKKLFYFYISFVLGIFLESAAYNWAPQYVKNWEPYLLAGFFVAAIACVVISFWPAANRKFYFGIIGFCVLFLLLGIMRFQISEAIIQNNLLRAYNDSSGKITLTGQIADAPDIRNNLQNITVSVKTLTVGGKEIKTGGDVLATLDNDKNYQYLDEVQVTGKLESPAVFSDFNYKDYLLKDGIYSVMYYPKVSVLSANYHQNAFTFLYANLLWFKGKLQSSIAANFSGPQQMLLEGIILGNNKNMTATLQNQLNATNLRYLTAISGAHIIILSAMLMALFLGLGFWRGQAFYFTVVFIWLYIILTGCSASGVRAGIMASIFLLAQKLGRQNTAGRGLALAGALMLLQNPMLLLYDAGFQLSFMACLGIIYFKPLLENLIAMVTKEYARNLVQIVAITITAQIFIIPLMAYDFGTVSLIAPVANLFIVPIFSWLMVLGFLTSLLGIFSGFLGWVFSVPTWVLLTYFLRILDIFSKPWASATIQHISWVWPVVYYAVLFGLVAFLQRTQKSESLGY